MSGRKIPTDTDSGFCKTSVAAAGYRHACRAGRRCQSPGIRVTSRTAMSLNPTRRHWLRPMFFTTVPISGRTVRFGEPDSRASSSVLGTRGELVRGQCASFPSHPSSFLPPPAIHLPSPCPSSSHQRRSALDGATGSVAPSIAVSARLRPTHPAMEGVFPFARIANHER